MFSRLYLHIPWCGSKCDYCAFSSAPGSVDKLAETCALLLREIELSPATSRPLKSIYFGGGTPSLLLPDQIAQLLHQIRQRWEQQTTSEITLEANPGTVTLDKLNGFRQAGVNRLSLGVQSFNDQALHRLGRSHLADDARSAFHAARSAGFTNIGIDLICGLPQQTLQDWQQDLHAATMLNPEHISVYSLSVEPGTPFAIRYPDEHPDLPDDDLTATMLELADKLLNEVGYDHYEIANFARPDFRSQHNSGYWQRDGYLGLGPSAHSLFAQDWGVRFCNPSGYQEWANALRAGRLAHHASETLTAVEALAEQLFLGLRMSDGILPDDCITLFGNSAWERHTPAIAELIANGLLYEQSGRVCLTRRGMLLSNQVFMRFV